MGDCGATTGAFFLIEESISLGEVVLETYLFNFFQFLNYFIVQLQLSAFSPHPSTPPQPNPPPSPASTLPLGFVQASFIVVPENFFKKINLIVP